MDKVFMSGTTDLNTMDNGSKTRSTEEVYTYGQMEEDTRENGRTIICTVRESTHGKTEESTSDNISMTESTDTVFTPGTTEDNTKVTGNPESNTEKVSTVKAKTKTSRRERVFGKTERESSGWMSKNKNDHNTIHTHYMLIAYFIKYIIIR
jgi:hypothetical protein